MITRFIFVFSFLWPTILVGQVKELKKIELVRTIYSFRDTINACMLMEEADRLFSEGKLDVALKKAKIANNIYTSVLKKKTEEVADSWYLVGKIHAYNNYIVEGKKALNIALDIQLKIFGEIHSKVAKSYNCLGTAYYQQGIYDRAAIYFEKALNIRLDIYGEIHSDVAASYDNLGIIYEIQGDYEKAFFYHKKALEIGLIVHGNTHSDVADSYNNLATVYNSQGKYEEAMSFYEKASEIWLIVYGESHRHVATSYNNMGIVWVGQGNYEKGIYFFSKSLEIWLKVYGEIHPHIANYNYNLGIVYEEQGNYEKAILYSRKALDMRISIYGDNHPDVANSYHHIGVIYQTQNDYKKAMAYYKKALELMLRIHEKTHSNIGMLYNSLGIIYHDKGKYEEALFYHEKALKIKAAVYGEVHPDVANSYNSLGVVMRDKKNYEKAILFFKKALEINLVIYDEKHPSIARFFNNLGAVYYDQDSCGNAKDYHEKALEVELVVYGKSHPDVAASYNNLGNTHRKSENYDSAIVNYKKALKAANFSDIDSLKLVNSLSVVIEIFKNMGICYYEQYSKTKNINNLLSAHYYCKQSIAVISNQSKFLRIFPQTAFEVYENAIKINQYLYTITDSIHYFDEALIHAEDSKAYNLYGAIQETNALYFANIPDSLLAQEDTLRLAITSYEKQRQEKLFANLPETDTTVLAISGKLFHLYQDYENLKTQLEEEYPDYYRLKYDLSTTNLQQVQTNLTDSTQTLLEYFVGDSSIYLFVINKNDFHFHEIKKDFPLEKWIQTFRDANATGKYDIMLLEYQQAAHNLYQKLIAPVTAQLKEKIIIIPDGVLGYLPFGALLVESPEDIFNWQEHHYWIKDKQISYCYSATLLKEMQDKQHDSAATKEMIAFAPYYNGDTVTLGNSRYGIVDSVLLAPLKNTGEEVFGIQEITGGEVYYHYTATEEQFRESVGDYKVIHLATHGQANDEIGDYCFLAFTVKKDTIENELLYVRDLYNLKLNAEMVVLSACETGVGELQKGEGIISLARGFTYAGTKSIITSLWRVNDKSTKDLMIAFYQNLYKKEMTKDEALRQAKLDYLKNVDDETKAHPYFWSGFIGIGDMKPISF